MGFEKSVTRKFQVRQKWPQGRQGPEKVLQNLKKGEFLLFCTAAGAYRFFVSFLTSSGNFCFDTFFEVLKINETRIENVMKHEKNHDVSKAQVL